MVRVWVEVSVGVRDGVRVGVFLWVGVRFGDTVGVGFVISVGVNPNPCNLEAVGCCRCFAEARKKRSEFLPHRLQWDSGPVQLNCCQTEQRPIQVILVWTTDRGSQCKFKQSLKIPRYIYIPYMHSIIPNNVRAFNTPGFIVRCTQSCSY